MYGREEEGKGTERKRQAEREVSGTHAAKTVAVQGKGNICQKSSLLLENEQENGHEPHESGSGRIGRGGPGTNSLGERFRTTLVDVLISFVFGGSQLQ